MTIHVIGGDCLAVLRLLDAESVHCCVTSPPYFGLRDYGHSGQIGLEQTPEAYVTKLVEVFREVRRVLRSDGTLWLNIADSYAGSWGAQSRGGPPSGKSTLRGNGHVGGGPKIHALSAVQVPAAPKTSRTGSIRMDGVKPKDLIGIPWMLAFALRADGWYLRQDIIWSKPNPMPESIKDRCTKAHEYVFLLSKSERYYFDHEAIKEPVAASTVARLAQDIENQAGSNRVPGKTNGPMKVVRSKRDSFKRDNSKRAEVFPGQSLGTHRLNREESSYPLDTRNKRSVWNVATRGYKGAHFATFPPALIEPCVLAGCPVGGTVLDPFFGSGTTGAVAKRFGRDAIGIELNADYVALAHERINAIDGAVSKRIVGLSTTQRDERNEPRTHLQIPFQRR